MTMRLAEVFQRLVGADAPVRFTGYDGSTAGPADAPATLEVRSPNALRYIATAPGDLGLARAFVAGDLEIHGDVHAALLGLVRYSRQNVPWSERVEILRGIGPSVLVRPQPPAVEAPPRHRRGRLHSKARDAAAIAHHYDVSNHFYEMVLGPSMAYTCAVYPKPDSSLEEAQEEKFDLVCRKLGLRPGMRLLDVGCGWGGMVRHAVQNYGVVALGVTLSKRQAQWARVALAEAGLSDRAEVRHLDYRDVPEGNFDAISSIGLTEHIGRAQLGPYVRFLAQRLRSGGRLLNHCITRPNGLGRDRPGGFIDRFVFPDGELLSPGTVVSAIHDHGFEVRHEENLREHYAMTLRDWSANLDRHWDAAVAEVGEGRARVWRLYLAASRVGFDVNTIQLHQVLAVRLGPDAVSGMPLRPDWGS